jgi:tetratricopeptide (TPR) repeat protein
VAGVVALAVAMLALGGLGPWGATNEDPGPRTAGARVSALTAAAGGDRLDATIASLQRLLGERAHWRPLASLGLAYLTKGRATADPAYYSKAEAVLRQSLRLHASGNTEARLGLGALAAARHDFHGALRWGRSAQRLNPQGADAYGVMADALVELGRYRRAGRVLQRMVDLRPGLASYARVSYYRELHGDVAGAIEAMSAALEFGGAGEDAAWAAYQLGELYFNSGRIVEARRQYARGAYLAPRYPLPKAGLAKVAAARGHIQRATRTLAPVVARYPAPELVILLGDLYRAAERPGRAATQWELVEAMQRLYESNGFDLDLELVLFDADHGRAPGATARRARRAFAARPGVAVADALAWALYRDGRYQQAIKASHRALRLGGANALFHYHAGMISMRLGDRRAARRHLRRALGINPNFSLRYGQAARRTLARLEGAAS